MNALLPPDISIVSIQAVQPNAHARYDAISRSYEYIITATKNPLLMGLAYLYHKPVSIERMNEAATFLIGEHDFECFSKVKTDVHHFGCTIKKATWKKEESTYRFYITANRFLRGMVRAIVGTMLDVGTGKISVSDFQQIIASRDRKRAGMNVPPQGLYLMRVVYPKQIYLKK